MGSAVILQDFRTKSGLSPIWNPMSIIFPWKATCRISTKPCTGSKRTHKRSGKLLPAEGCSTSATSPSSEWKRCLQAHILANRGPSDLQGNLAGYSIVRPSCLPSWNEIILTGMCLVFIHSYKTIIVYCSCFAWIYMWNKNIIKILMCILAFLHTIIDTYIIAS